MSNAPERAELEAERDICRRRGHQPANYTLTSNPPLNVCQWCGAVYRVHDSDDYAVQYWPWDLIGDKR